MPKGGSQLSKTENAFIFILTEMYVPRFHQNMIAMITTKIFSHFSTEIKFVFY